MLPKVIGGVSNRQPPVSPAQTGAAAAAGAAAIGSPAWLAGASSSALGLYDSMLSPDYSSVPAPNLQGAADYATQGAAAWMQAQVEPINKERNVLLAQKNLSTDAATNFNQALAGILTGGLEGQAGRDYALKTFGGSYLGEVQTVQGQKMLIDLTRDFSERDMQLVNKIADFASQSQQVYKDLYTDFYNNELANQKMGIDLAESDYDHRVKAVALMATNARAREAQAAATQRNNADNLTKIITAMKKTGAVPVILTRGDGSKALIDKTSGHTIQELSPPKPVKPVKKPAVRTYPDPKGVVWRINPDGSYTDTGSRVAPSQSSSGSKITFQGIRKGALAAAQKLWVSKQRPPTRKQAFDSLMVGYGNVLLANGYKRTTVERMINNVMKSASAARWDKVGTKAAPQPGGLGSVFGLPTAGAG